MTTSPLPMVAIVVSQYNQTITRTLEAGAIRAYEDAGGDADSLGVFETAGAYELTAVSRAAATSGLYRGVVALGCVIRGHTRHDRYIGDAVARGLTDIAVTTGVPVAFGVLTVESQSQAEARADGAYGNKGTDAMLAVLESIAAITLIEASAGTPTRGLVYRLTIKPNDKTGAPD